MTRMFRPGCVSVFLDGLRALALSANVNQNLIRFFKLTMLLFGNVVFIWRRNVENPEEIISASK